MTTLQDDSRSSAITESGWGTRPVLVQPRNPAWWVYLFLVGDGIYTALRYLVIAPFPVYGGTLLVLVILFGVYGALFWWFTERIDRYARISTALIVAAVLWGGFAATFAMAAPANTPILSLYAKAFGQPWSLDWGAGLTAPFVEETAKGAGLVLLIALAPRLIATAFDGFILGAFIGLGFQVLEDLQYALGGASSQYGADPFKNALTVVIFRMGFGVASHVLFSAIFCTGLVYFIGRPALARRRGLGVAFMAFAMLAHGLWDDAGGIGGSNVLILVLLWIVLIGLDFYVVTRVYAVAVVPERDFLRRVMAPEAAAGAITDEELTALSGDRHARKAYRKAGHGIGDHLHRRHRLAAARDLAEQLAKDGGHDTDRVAFARSELTRLGEATSRTESS